MIHFKHDFGISFAKLDKNTKRHDAIFDIKPLYFDSSKQRK